ncbi:MAG: sugar phosphate isomerase/epimerase [Lachnospiraceae bacterium]|nr:sugar phosphate isomerase/epimerase [Lachnospiraceae bacterium]
MDRQIGAQLFTVREFTKTIGDFEETCRKIKEIGYKVVQISGTPLKAEEMKAVLDKYNLKVVTTHRSFDDFLNNLDEVMEYNKILGCELCGVGSMPGKYRDSFEGVSQFIEEMNEIAAKLKKECLYFGYHNHAFEFVKLNGKFIMDRLIEESDPDAVKFIVDTYWLQFGGLNPAKFIKKLGERAMVIHFKDLKINLGSVVEMAEVGEGNLDWDAIIAACDEAGAKWALVEQDICQRDSFESMKISYEYLRTKGFC